MLGSPMAGAAGDELPRATGSLESGLPPSRSTILSGPANAHNGRPKQAKTAAAAARGVGAGQELGELAHPSRHTAGTEGEETMTRGATPSLARLRGRATSSGVEADPSTTAHLDYTRRLSRKGNPVRVQSFATPRDLNTFKLCQLLGTVGQLIHITRNSRSPSFLTT